MPAGGGNPAAMTPRRAAKPVEDDDLAFQDEGPDLSVRKGPQRTSSESDAESTTGYGVGRKDESPAGMGLAKSPREAIRPASKSAGEYKLSTDRPSRAAPRTQRASWNGPIGPA